MTYKNALFLSLFPLLAACNTNKAAENKTGADSLQANTTPKDIPGQNPTTGINYDAEIAAQDSVFEDGSTPSSWANAGFTDPVAFKRFIIQFKDWVRHDNVDSVAAHIRFPMKKIATAEDLKTKYTSVFNEHVKTAIANQHLDHFFRNQDGAMFDGGLIWFTASNNGYFITAINN